MSREKVREQAEKVIAFPPNHKEEAVRLAEGVRFLLGEVEETEDRYTLAVTAVGALQKDRDSLKARLEEAKRERNEYVVAYGKAKADRDRLREKANAADALVAAADVAGANADGNIVPTKEWEALCALYPQPTQEDQEDA